MVHLTNDAIQIHSDEYGKFEPGNKLSYREFQRFLDSSYPEKHIDFARDLCPQIKRVITDTIRATYGKIQRTRCCCTIEIFGYDFMIDEHFFPWLIEINTNPCLETTSPLLSKLIPTFLSQVIRVAIDPMFPSPDSSTSKKGFVGDGLQEIKFELVFDEKYETEEVLSLGKEKEQMESINNKQYLILNNEIKYFI